MYKEHMEKYCDSFKVLLGKAILLLQSTERDASRFRYRSYFKARLKPNELFLLNQIAQDLLGEVSSEYPRTEETDLVLLKIFNEIVRQILIEYLENLDDSWKRMLQRSVEEQNQVWLNSKMNWDVCLNSIENLFVSLATDQKISVTSVDGQTILSFSNKFPKNQMQKIPIPAEIEVQDVMDSTIEICRKTMCSRNSNWISCKKELPKYEEYCAVRGIPQGETEEVIKKLKIAGSIWEQLAMSDFIRHHLSPFWMPMPAPADTLEGFSENWINIRRHPNPGTFVFVSIFNPSCDKEFSDIRYCNEIIYGEFGRIITHWMPIPDVSYEEFCFDRHA